MKLRIAFTAFVLSIGFASAQGTFLYDQQSTNVTDGGILISQTPFGQSFTPAFDSIDFVQFFLTENIVTSTVAINIRSGSITGTILGTTLSTSVNPISSGYRDFLFPNRISLTAGTKYFFEPVVVAGGGVVADLTFVQYPGGDAIYNGSAFSDRDFLFREGIIIPEPASLGLFAFGIGAMFCRKSKLRT